MAYGILCLATGFSGGSAASAASGSPTLMTFKERGARLKALKEFIPNH